MQAIAVFITPHGYGHAARAAAVMAAIARRRPTRFEIFTQVGEAFFTQSLETPFGYHPLVTDVGLVQQDAFHEDIPATVAALSRFYPIPDEAIAAAGRALCRTHCELVLCDVAPMGILAARAAGISAVLIENFTWDWIYRNYSPCPPALATQADRLAAIYATVDRRLQTEPLCAPVPGCLRLPPIARRPHTTATTTRRRLGVARAQPLVLVTMGGLPEPHTFHAALQDRPEFCFVLPGSGEDIRQDGNVITLPHHSDFYHPDLVAAADVVVGKLGYSTVAEVYCAARRFLYVRRPHFPESPPMAAFVDRTITSVGISVSALRSATWLQHLDALLATPSLAPAHPNGDDAAAAAVLDGLPSRGK